LDGLSFGRRQCCAVHESRPTIVAKFLSLRFAWCPVLGFRRSYPPVALSVPPRGGDTVGLIGAVQMAHSSRTGDEDDVRAAPPFLLAVISRAVIGFVAGVTGIGGGILFAPLILTLGWADVRQTSAVTAAFNLLNSAAAFAGVWMRHSTFSLGSPWWLLAVVCGGLLGSWLAVRALPT
jgi:hypothetical protein